METTNKYDTIRKIEFRKWYNGANYSELRIIGRDGETFSKIGFNFEKLQDMYVVFLEKKN